MDDKKIPKNKKSRYNLRKRKKKNYKLNNNSDDSDSDYDPEENITSEESDAEENFDRDEYKKFISKIFPSKYMTERAKTPKKKRKKAAAIKREQKQQKQNNYLGRYKRFY